DGGRGGLAKLEGGVLAVLGVPVPPSPLRGGGSGGRGLGSEAAEDLSPPAPLSEAKRGEEDIGKKCALAPRPLPTGPPVRNGEGGERSWPLTLRDYLATVTLGSSADDVAAEPWFHPADPLPAANPPDTPPPIISALANASVAAGLTWGTVRSVVVPAPRFNRLLDEWRRKSGVLATGVIALLNATLDLPGDDPIFVTVDKLGGRHFYAPLLNEAFPGGWVRVIREGRARCEYAIDGLGREIHLRFEPRADGAHLSVALASMAAKYLREVCMMQFNRYWLAKVPGLKPTAGYPSDAGRFFADIRGVLAADGTDERMVWRER